MVTKTEKRTDGGESVKKAHSAPLGAASGSAHAAAQSNKLSSYKLRKRMVLQYNEASSRTASRRKHILQAYYRER